MGGQSNKLDRCGLKNQGTKEAELEQEKAEIKMTEKENDRESKWPESKLYEKQTTGKVNDIKRKWQGK